MEPGLLEHVRAHHQVGVPVAAGIGPVRADPTDLGREVEDELGRTSSKRRAAASIVVRSKSRRLAATTSCPSDSSRSTSREPTKPPPPVTSALHAQPVAGDDGTTPRARLRRRSGRGLDCAVRPSRASGTGNRPDALRQRPRRLRARRRRPPLPRDRCREQSSTSARVQNFMKCGGRSRSGFSRSSRFVGLCAFGKETSKTRSPPGFSVRAISPTARVMNRLPMCRKTALVSAEVDAVVLRAGVCSAEAQTG